MAMAEISCEADDPSLELSEYEKVIQGIHEDVKKDCQRRDAMKHEFFEYTKDIPFMDFRNKNRQDMMAVEIEVDISPTRDKFASLLGLDYNTILHCNTYYRLGPTQKVFSILEEKNVLQHLTLFTVLSLLREIELPSVFTVINWEECIARYKEASQSNQAFPPMVHEGEELLVNAASVGQNIVNEENFTCQIHSNPEPKRKFGAKVLLIFASDAREEALRVVQQLKTSTENRGGIGVIILIVDPTPVVTNALAKDPWNSISKWFRQVDFVVPVLSRQLLLQIQARDSNASTRREMQINRYVYRLLHDDYVSNNLSRNMKCRPLCSQEGMTEVRESELVKGNGLLEMNWDCTPEDVERLAEILIIGAREMQN